MRYWMDAEFLEDGITIDLLSIGIVSEDGRIYYAQDKGCDLTLANDWVKANVIPHLDDVNWKVRSEIRRDILEFMDIEKYGKPEIWTYYGAYDWVAFCQIFGKMIDLPKGFPMYARDIKQLCDDLGNPRLPVQGKDEHNALQDAAWNKLAWESLKAFQVSLADLD